MHPLATSRSTAPLFRFTSFGSLLRLLETKSLTFSDPANWADRNDIHVLNEYGTRMKYQTVRALCFTQASETFHHWRVFAEGPDGVCIVFHRERLLSEIELNPHVRHEPVVYRQMKHLPKDPPSLADLPFQKRWPYRDELEYRAIFELPAKTKLARCALIKGDCILEVKFSPWLKTAMVKQRRERLRCIEGWKNFKIYPTTILENEAWKKWCSRSTQ